MSIDWYMIGLVVEVLGAFFAIVGVIVAGVLYHRGEEVTWSVFWIGVILFIIGWLITLLL